MLWAPPLAAEPGDPAPGVSQRSVPMGKLTPRAAKPAQSQQERWSPGRAVWPAAGSIEVDLPAPSSAGGAGARVRAGAGPVWVGRGAVGAQAGTAVVDQPGRVRLDVSDQRAAEAAGVSGMVFRLRRTDGGTAPAPVAVDVDVSGFAGAYGGDWASRLRLVRLPACALTTPQVSGCATPTPVASRVDSRRMRLSATVEVGAAAVSERSALTGSERDGTTGGASVLAVTATATSSDTGDFGQTPFSHSYEWTGGTSSADFGWSYELGVPPSPGGLDPEVSFGYSSGAVDGQTAGKNVQPGPIGEGWEYQPGFIERSYRACLDDVQTFKDVRMYPGNGAGGFAPPYPVVGQAFDATNSVLSPGDFDGDGKPDLIFRRALYNGIGNTLRLVRGNGAGGFIDEPRPLAAGDWSGAQWLHSPGDFTGDGLPDLIWRETTGRLMLRRGAPGGTLAAVSEDIGSFSSASFIFSVGDFSGDGKPDVLWKRASDGLLFMMRGNGVGRWVTGQSELIGDFNGANYLFGRGDFSGDGKPDVLWRRTTDNALLMIRGNGTGGWVTGQSEQIGSGWGGFGAIVAPGDFSGDGKADVLGTQASTWDPEHANATGDLCWRLPNARIVWGGKSTELVIGDDGTWRMADDDAAKVELLTGAGNGDNDGEYWRVTTTDGTQLYFGRHRLPNWSTGNRETNSTWRVPVFANHAGEPCYVASAFASSYCLQAWRWNLDHVVDRHGSSMTYFYTREGNRTGLAGSPSSTVGYDKGGALTSIEYCTRTGQEYSTTAPARVLFNNLERCFTSCWAGTPWLSAPNRPNWPDTPFDLACDAAPCTSNVSPSFWSAMRLASVVTQAWSGSGSTYHTVDQWDLGHQFPSTGNGTSPVLWLESITRTGKADGGSDALPPVTFGGTRFDQRADYDPNATMAQPRKYRITTVSTETGGQLVVAYDGQDTGCQFGSPFPNPDLNSRRCFPQYYSPQQAPPGWSWWHKYRVSSVTERDLVGGSPDVVHAYAYATTGASTGVLWAHDDGAATFGARTGRKSWSQWRGYPSVTVTTGPAGNQSQARYLYFRGLHGDYTDNGEGTRTSTITNALGEVSQDHEQYTGFLHQKIEYSAPGGPELRRTIYDPTRFLTGQRHLPVSWAIPSTQPSYVVRPAKERTQTWLAASSAWRTMQTVNAWDTTYGVITTVDDQGDVSTTSDDRCTRTWYTYGTGAGAYLIDYPNRTETVGVACSAVPVYPDDAVSDSRVYYDGASAHGTAPSTGNVTRNEAVVSYSGTTPAWIRTGSLGYDQWGRVTSASDALDKTTNTTYTQGTHGLTATVEVRNPMLHGTVTTFNVARGVPTTVTDPNGKVTTASYDALGRLVKVWLPGRATSLTPSTEYGYTVSRTAASSIVTKTLSPNDTQILSYGIVDGLLRPRQTQTTAPDGNRVIADTAYDGRGLAVKASELYNNASGPTGTLGSFTDAAVGRQVRSTYDGLGRVLTGQLWSQGVEKWRTTTTYGGDRVDVDPPAGGTATTALADARGRTTALRQYSGGAPTGPYDETAYTYDDADRLTRVTDPVGNHWDFTHDLLGRQLTAVDPDTGTRTNAYDNAGRLIRSTDGRGQTLAYAYDDIDRRVETRDTSPTGTLLASWSYDTLARGQLTSSTRLDTGNAYTSAVTGYDDGYRPLGTTVTIPAVEGGLAGTYTTGYTYKVNGAPATVTLPAMGGLPAETLVHGYNAAGRPSSLSGASPYVASTAYHWDGQVSQQLLGAGDKRVRLTTAVDEGSRRLLTQQVDIENPTTPDTWDDKSTNEYAYDAAGNVLSVAGNTGGVRDQVECFAYDHLRRLTEAWTQANLACGTPQRTGADPYWLTWTYDKTGNRTSQVDHGATGSTTSTYAYPAAGGVRPHGVTQATRSGATTGTDAYSYDNAGNTMSRDLVGQPDQTLTWDAEGHLARSTQAGQDTTFVYSAGGNRLLRREPGATTLYLGSDEYRLNTASGQVTGTRYYAGVAVRTVTGVTWLTADHHGTNQLAIDSTSLQMTRRRSLPFGSPRGSQPGSWPGEKGFVGGTKDATTGLTHLGAREYDPATGRFVSADPIRDFTDPQQIHGYSYAHANPLAFSDAGGLADCADDDCRQRATPKPGGGKNIKGKVPPPPRPLCSYTDSCGDDGNPHKRKKKPNKPFKPRDLSCFELRTCQVGTLDTGSSDNCSDWNRASATCFGCGSSGVTAGHAARV